MADQLANGRRIRQAAVTVETTVLQQSIRAHRRAHDRIIAAAFDRQPSGPVEVKIAYCR